MQIIIDARVLADKMHGIARYTYNLILNLAKLDHENYYTILYHHTPPQELITGNSRFQLHCFPVKLYSLAEQIYLPLLIKKLKADIYHSPTFSAPLIQPCNVLMTIHDMIHLTHGNRLSMLHSLYYSLIVRNAALRAAGIITVTNYSQQEITKHLNIPSKKIHVTHNGIDLTLFSPAQSDSLPLPGHLNLSPGYLLYVGNPKPHKNVQTLIGAYILAKETVPALPRLVLVGVPPDYLKKNFKKSDLKSITSIQSGSDDELLKLYRNASLFIAPSLQEGFGLPMLEALACGVPTITSDIPPIREVLGDAAIFIDPANPDQIGEAIKKLHQDKKLKESLIEKGLEQSKHFKWEETAKKTLLIYKKLV